MKQRKIDYTTHIEYICRGKQFKDELHKWNYILRNMKMDVVQVQKANKREEEAQRKHKRRGVPHWCKAKR